jgi:hypothetical protein
MIRPADKDQGFRQAPHGCAVNLRFVHAVLLGEAAKSFAGSGARQDSNL